MTEDEEKVNNSIKVVLEGLHRLPEEWQAVTGVVDDEAEEKQPQQAVTFKFYLPREGDSAKEYQYLSSDLAEETDIPPPAVKEEKEEVKEEAKEEEKVETEVDGEEKEKTIPKCISLKKSSKVFLLPAAKQKVIDMVKP